MFTVAFLLTPEFSLVNVASAIDTLRVANSLLEQPYYRWVIASDSGPSVASSSGLALTADVSFAQLDDFDLLLICGSFKPHKYENKDTQRRLRHLSRHGRKLGSMEAGVYHLAKSGALDGHPAAAHYANLPVYARMFPKVRFVQNVFTAGPARVTSAGGLTGLDLMAHLVGERFGSHFARKVANLLQAPWIRGADEMQSGLTALAGSSVPQTVQDACRLMERHMEQPLAVPDIAARMRVSRRQLDRQFQRAFAATAADVYMLLRLSRARKLLRSSTMKLSEVADACGFNSYPSFTRRYGQTFGHSPARERRVRGGAASVGLKLMPILDLHPDQSMHDPAKLL